MTGKRQIRGGRYAPLAEADLTRIEGAVLEVLSSVGMSEAPTRN